MSSQNISLPKFDLSGKSALITGGAGLLGKEHALALLEVGANVVLWDINKENLMRVTNELTKDFSEQSVKMSVVDISKEEEVNNAFKELELQGIAISILINNKYCPISFRTVDSIDYKKAMLVFYEQNNLSAFKKIFMEQFEFAVNTYF